MNTLHTLRDLSPFRYPGGKGWFVPRLLDWLGRRPLPARLFLEPFAGGASAGLAVAASRLAGHVLLIERDPDVAVVWRCLLGPGAQALIERVRAFEPGEDSVAALLESRPQDPVDAAFRVLVRNRLARERHLHPDAPFRFRYHKESGRLYWRPDTLAARIRAIAQLAPTMEFVEADALELLPCHLAREDVALFLDPPYSVGAQASHRHYYRHTDLDHDRLFGLLRSGRAPFLMLYDDLPAIRDLVAAHGFACARATGKAGHTVHDLLIARNRADLEGLIP